MVLKTIGKHLADRTFSYVLEILMMLCLLFWSMHQINKTKDEFVDKMDCSFQAAAEFSSIQAKKIDSLTTKISNLATTISNASEGALVGVLGKYRIKE